MTDKTEEEGPTHEGTVGVNRVEAFSDGVIAIIVTIMVLELRPPESADLESLWRLWPIFIAYVLSYAYVAIYWVNHHRLFGHVRGVTNGLLWANISLLFSLSLVPFATAYLGEHHFARDATLLYLVTLLLPSLTYAVLQRTVRGTGIAGQEAETYHRATTRKGLAALVIYAIGIPLAFVAPWMGIACAALVAVLWMLPWSPLDKIFLRRGDLRASLQDAAQSP
jgi:uncharacterized membrane protein